MDLNLPVYKRKYKKRKNVIEIIEPPHSRKIEHNGQIEHNGHIEHNEHIVHNRQIGKNGQIEQTGQTRKDLKGHWSIHLKTT